MAKIPKPLSIFHITAIPNIEKIANEGALLANAILLNRKVDYDNIAYQGAQSRRANKKVTCDPGGVIHDYVPFYFAPRSPMLYTINQGNVPDCPYRQEDIVHLVSTVEQIDEAELPFVFYNHNATLEISECFNDLNDLDQIKWDLFFEDPKLDGYCRYWHNKRDTPKYAMRMETRQAEFLVHRTVSLDHIQRIGTYSEDKARVVRKLLKAEGIEIPVEAKTTWYF